MLYVMEEKSCQFNETSVMTILAPFVCQKQIQLPNNVMLQIIT